MLRPQRSVCAREECFNKGYGKYCNTCHEKGLLFKVAPKNKKPICREFGCYNPPVWENFCQSHFLDKARNCQDPTCDKRTTRGFCPDKCYQATTLCNNPDGCHLRVSLNGNDALCYRCR